jgi:hypothetical protein
MRTHRKNNAKPRAELMRTHRKNNAKPRAELMRTHRKNNAKPRAGLMRTHRKRARCFSRRVNINFFNHNGTGRVADSDIAKRTAGAETERVALASLGPRLVWPRIRNRRRRILGARPVWHISQPRTVAGQSLRPGRAGTSPTGSNDIARNVWDSRPASSSRRPLSRFACCP